MGLCVCRFCFPLDLALHLKISTEVIRKPLHYLHCEKPGQQKGLVREGVILRKTPTNRTLTYRRPQNSEWVKEMNQLRHTVGVKRIHGKQRQSKEEGKLSRLWWCHPCRPLCYLGDEVAMTVSHSSLIARGRLIKSRMPGSPSKWFYEWLGSQHTHVYGKHTNFSFGPVFSLMQSDWVQPD